MIINQSSGHKYCPEYNIFLVYLANLSLFVYIKYTVNILENILEV